MGIKEVKGRSLPGRSEEPSPERPTPTISGAEGKHAASEHQRERSEFEQRKGDKATRRGARKGPELEASEFERGGRAVPRLNDPADDLERYPFPGNAGQQSAQAWGELPSVSGSQPEPDAVLWGDGYDGEPDAQGAAAAPDHSGEPEEEEDEDEPFVEDLWVGSDATPVAPEAPTGGPSDLWEANRPEQDLRPSLSAPQAPGSPLPRAKEALLPVATQVTGMPGSLAREVIPAAPPKAPGWVAAQAPAGEPVPAAPQSTAVIAARTMEFPAVEPSPSPAHKPVRPEVRRSIPPGAAGPPSSEGPTQEVTAVDLPAAEDDAAT